MAVGGKRKKGVGKREYWSIGFLIASFHYSITPIFHCGEYGLFQQPVRLKEGGVVMLSWSITFLVVGLIAGLLGLSGIAGAATQIAWILFVVFLVLFLVSLVMGRRPPV